MTNNTPPPAGQPWEQQSGGQPVGTTEMKPKRPWFKKKRVIIPAGVLALIIGIGSCGGGGDIATTDQTTQVEETTPTAEPTADAEAEASAEAEAEAAKTAEAEAEGKG